MSRLRFICNSFISRNSLCTLFGERSFTSLSFVSIRLLKRSKILQEHMVSPRFSSSDSKVYTKTGDKGSSSLYSGERRLKNDRHFDALGNIDELSSYIGLAKEYGSNNKHVYVDQLERIQCILQDILTLIATPKPNQPLKDPEREKRRQEKFSINQRHIEELEEWIDKHTEKLPVLSNFILPGGGKTGATLHVCRSVCRRAERSLISLVNDELLDPHVLAYVNRLSDYLFTLARIATLLDNQKETIYISPKFARDKKE